MKRLNPETGEPFRYGDTREDGKVFRQYFTGRITKDGYFRESWVTKEAFEACRTSARTWRYRDPKAAKNSWLKTAYGITLDDYDRLHAAQSGKCWICETPETSTGTLHVDHCHDTGEVRGLLCGNCNRALGLIQSRGDVDVIASRMVKYMHQRPAQTVLTCGET